MDNAKRTFIRHTTSVSLIGLAAAAGLISPDWVNAANSENLFEATGIDDALSRLADGIRIENSDKIGIEVPKVAENGAMVPITVSSSLADTQSIAVLAEKNPVPLVARFELGATANPVVGARIKMAETSHVIVIVKAKERLYSSRKLVKVTVGGCGS